jgi:hypothetical protein
MIMQTMSRFFPYDFDRRFRLIWRSFGVDPEVDGVTLTDDGRLGASFGRFRVDTPLSNVADVTNTGPYHWWKSVGLRASAADTGITFGTTNRVGACILFKEPIPQVVPPRPGHAGLTVTVVEPDKLVAAVKDGKGA